MNISDSNHIQWLCDLLQSEPQNVYKNVGKLSDEQCQEVLLFLDHVCYLEQQEKAVEALTKSDGEQFPARLYSPNAFEVWGFDTEDDGKGNCHLLVFKSAQRRWLFTSRERALLWLIYSEFETDIIMYCVNTEYDINNLCWGYDHLMNRLYNKSRFISSRLQRPSEMRLKAIKFYDLVNFYSLSAAKVAELFGLKKHDFDFSSDRRYDKNGRVIPEKKEIEYCVQDAEIARVAGQFIVDKFVDYDINFASTVASCAMQIWLRHFDKWGHSRNVESSVPPGPCYASYYGGRVEAFRIGKVDGNILYFDVNSLYPFVMKHYHFPVVTGPTYYSKQDDISCGLMKATVTVPEDILPPLPYRHKGKLLFPVGTFTGIWTLPEIINALNHGATLNTVHYAYGYYEVAKLFEGYIDEMWQKRKTATTPADNKFYKVLMNSLYGKFGQQSRSTEWVYDSSVSGFVEETKTSLGSHAGYIVASYVTAYARVTLYQYMIEALECGAELLYCDTDSVILKGIPIWQDSTELGDMKLEAKCEWVDIRGLKQYQYKIKDGPIMSVWKGVPKHCQAEMFEHGQASFKRPIRYRESKRRNIQPNIWQEMSKNSLTEYGKRHILPDGNTRPLRVSELEP